jgi:hypothetical protein
MDDCDFGQPETDIRIWLAMRCGCPQLPLPAFFGVTAEDLTIKQNSFWKSGIFLTKDSG